MQMPDADLISSVRGIRNLVAVLDSIGYPLQDLSNDKELSVLISKDLIKKIKSTASDIHSTLQKIENSKRYKDCVYRLCNIVEKKTFNPGDYNG